ncbi:MAG: hypothetical protein ACM3VZ_11430 [Acidobacteriota bacterium]
MSEKQSKVSRVGGKRPGAGRPKGSVDKGNALIREMIVEALHGVGGVTYLMEQAREKPVAFLGLVGKVMPVQVQADIDANVAASITVTFK